MRNRLVLLPGWGLGSAPLEPLAAALQGLDERLRVQIEPLPAPGSADLDEWLDELDSALPEDVWLGGWSLGGMLAAELAARRGERCCGLLTMASNVCFVARDDWPQAMAANTFAEFQAACAANPAVCLKRFSVLCAQGSEDARGMARLLASAAPVVAPEALLQGLALLAAMDTRAALQGFAGPQLHLFGADDGLVPAEAAGALLTLLPDVEVGLIEQVGHAFVVERPHEVAAAIQAFLHEVEDD